MYGNSNNALTTRQGYWIEMQPALANQNFTIEAFFLIENLAPAFAEYKIENVVSTFWMSDGKGLELRLMGDFGEGQLQMMTHDGSAEHNSGTANGAIAINTWYHCAVVYNHSTGQASFYLDKALIGSANANWSNYTMKWLCIGAWPNPAGSCRDIAGYIDAFAVSDTALDPDDFELYKVTAVDDWTLF